jgi:hypothetical protein
LVIRKSDVHGNEFVFIMIFLFFVSNSVFAASLNVTWDVNKESDVLGYRVYYGTAPHSYRFSVDVGRETQCEILGVVEDMRYYVAVTAIDYSGNESVYSREVIAVPGQGEVIAQVPKALKLGFNFPNPFVSETIIPFEVPKRQHISIVIYNRLGQKIKSLESRTFDADYYNTGWDGTDAQSHPVSAGVYFYRLESQDVVITRPMLYLK